MKLAGRLEQLCSTDSCIPETFLAEAFARVKTSLKNKLASKRQTSKCHKIRLVLSFCGVLWDCCCACPAFSPQHKWPGIHLQLGQMRTVFYMISVGELCHLHPQMNNTFFISSQLFSIPKARFPTPKIQELDLKQISDLADFSGKQSATRGNKARKVSSVHLGVLRQHRKCCMWLWQEFPRHSWAFSALPQRMYDCHVRTSPVPAPFHHLLFMW